MDSNVQQGYNQWASTYDEVDNKTRDLDEQATQHLLSKLPFHSILELGCGTGKNTLWLSQRAKVTAIDFSEEMIARAKSKITDPGVEFIQGDITKPWPLDAHSFDAITCNLVLEHVEHLDFIFREANRVLRVKGNFFISELHPSKQYLGSKARFESDSELNVLDCFVHHASDFFNSAVQHGFTCVQFHELFDNDDRNAVPRLINFLFEKNGEYVGDV